MELDRLHAGFLGVGYRFSSDRALSLDDRAFKLRFGREHVGTTSLGWLQIGKVGLEDLQEGIDPDGVRGLGGGEHAALWILLNMHKSRSAILVKISSLKMKAIYFH